jgi:hypothetical protein
VDYVDYVADSNDINFHEWRDRILGSPAIFSSSPASSLISLPSTGSDQEFIHQFDTFVPPPSPDSLSPSALSTTISALSLENGSVSPSQLSLDGIVPYNGSSNSPTASSYGFPSPTPSNSSSHFSNSGWEDANYLSPNNVYQSDWSGESPPLPPLGANNSSGFFSSYQEIFPPGIFSVIPGSPDQRSPDQLLPYSLLLSSASSPEPLTGVSDPLRDDLLSPISDWDLFHLGPELPTRQYISHFRNPSQPEFIEASSSQAIPCKTEAPDPKVSFKPQVTSEAADAVSNQKRKNPPICTCDICGRGFTRKHSRACKFNSLFRFLRLELIFFFHPAHMLAHIGERTKLCNFCGNRFAGTLSRHKKTCKENPNRQPPKRKLT